MFVEFVEVVCGVILDDSLLHSCKTLFSHHDAQEIALVVSSKDDPRSGRGANLKMSVILKMLNRVMEASSTNE